MNVALPKYLRTARFDRLYAVEMNDFDVERLLPSLFHLIVTQGRERGRRANDPQKLGEYIEKLAGHERLTGFDSSSGKRLLERWVRSSIVHMSGVGRGRKGGEQIEYVQPLNILAYKPGFPAESSRQRNVHRFVYRALLGSFHGPPENLAKLRESVAKEFIKVFGAGAHIDTRGQKFDGTYDGETDLDIHSLLALCFLDGFEASGAGRFDRSEAHAAALPRPAAEFGQDLLLYPLVYRERLPPFALTRGFMSLIGLHLFVYTVRLMLATNRLVRTGELPAAMQADYDGVLEPELYVDFTRQRGGRSDELARACVERDLEELHAYYRSALLLQTISRYTEFQPALAARLKDLDTPDYLHTLTTYRGESDIEASARNDLLQIQAETLNTYQGEAEQGQVHALFEELATDASRTALDKVVQLVAASQERKTVTKQASFFGAAGGLNKSIGMLTGNTRGRRGWSYAMGDELLVTLVQLALIDRAPREMAAGTRPRIRLREFLEFLERRFGILVDRPPAFVDSAAARAAARDNFDALKRRLRQMGYFQELSDDFTAQYLRDPGQKEPVQP